MENCGSSADYWSMCLAATVRSFQRALDKSPASLQNYLFDEDLSKCFAVPMQVEHNVSMHGHSASSAAEAAMAANLKRGIRKLGHDPFRMITTFGDEEQRRFYDRKREAMKTSRGQGDDTRPVVMPETIFQDLKKMRLKPDYLKLRSATRVGTTGEVKIQVQGSRNGVDGTSTVVTRLDIQWCECGVPQLHKRPCKEQVFACEQLRVPVETLLQGIDTLAHWRSQYAEDIGEFRIPGTAALDAEGGVALLRPKSGPVRAGAPSMRRKASAGRKARGAMKKKLGDFTH